MKKQICHFALLGIGIVFMSITVGCQMPAPTPVVIDYKILQNDSPAADLQGKSISITPFADARTDDTIIGKRVLRDGDDIGIWVANALRLELEHAGARVDTLESGARPAEGDHVSGRVNKVKCVFYGWAPGGVLAAIIGTGYSANMDITLDLIKNGIPVLSKQYSIKKKVNSDAFKVIMVGAGGDDITKTLEIGLREVIRTQIFPDIIDAIE